VDIATNGEMLLGFIVMAATLGGLLVASAITAVLKQF
jgi:hypothetical protein